MERRRSCGGVSLGGVWRGRGGRTKMLVRRMRRAARRRGRECIVVVGGVV